MYEEDYALPSEKRFENLINRDSNEPGYVQGVDYELGTPVEIFDSFSQSNTQIDLINLKNTRFGNQQVIYKRIPPARILHRLSHFGVEYIEPPPLPFTTADIVALINDLGMLALQPHEYLNQTYEEPLEEVTLTIVNASLAWLPGTISIPLISANARLTEDGDTRITEDGEVRILE